MKTVMMVGIRELARRWSLALACLLLVMVPVGLFLSLRMFLSGMRAEYSRISDGMLVVQKSDSMGEIYGSRLGPQTDDATTSVGIRKPHPGHPGHRRHDHHQCRTAARCRSASISCVGCIPDPRRSEVRFIQPSPLGHDRLSSG